MTHEEKLKAIIEAQIEGGYKQWKLILSALDDGIPSTFNFLLEFEGKKKRISASLLEILLDTQGLKAVYGEGIVDDGNLPIESWLVVAKQIHIAWHSGEGNNWQAALNTAYELLTCK